MENYNERIDKIIASTGVLSRKDTKRAAKEGRIKVNGSVVKDCSLKVSSDDVLSLDDKTVVYNKYKYVMMNKPKGYVCSTDDPSSPIVNSLLSEELQRLDLFSIGRLDKNTTGLIILTNNGVLAHNLISPTKHIDKKYFVKSKLAIDICAIDTFAEGVVLEDGYVCRPAILEIVSESSAYVTIREGKYHQIKRMFESIGNQVVELERISIGDLALDNRLKYGDYRFLTPDEITLLGG